MEEGLTGTKPMTNGNLGHVLRHLRGLAGPGDKPDPTDGDLLHRFRARHEEAAFAVLVQRHGPLVLGVCRRILRDPDLADDAFQATFLVLVRRAGSIRRPESLANWLYGVARLVALKARAEAARRRSREREAVGMPAPQPRDETSWNELRAVLDEELARLPEKYRAPLVLCYLEGKTHDQAARELGCPRTSLTSRLGRARALLHRRLSRRGIALAFGVLPAALAAEAPAQVPAALLLATTRAAVGLAGGAGAAAASHALALAEGASKAMTMTRFLLGLALASAVAAVVTTAGALAGNRTPPAPDGDAGQPAPRLASADKPEDGPYLFRDVTRGSGVDFTYRNGEEAGQYTLLETLGGGVALIDYDNDGLLDLFVTGGGYFTGPDGKLIKGHPCKLYRNLGNWRFQDVTTDAGLGDVVFYTHGAAVIDYDCDGWPDLLVTGYDGLALFHNEPDGKGGRRFVDVTKRAGLAGAGWHTSAAWADLDGDGFADLYVCRYVNWSMTNNPIRKDALGRRDVCLPKAFAAQPHALYRNNGDGTFTDVSKEAGLRVPRTEKDYEQLDWLSGDGRGVLRGADRQKEYGKGLGVVMVDVNGDGKPDIFVANDTTGNFLYVNRSVPGHIRLKEIALPAGVALDTRGVACGSHGVAAGDYDGSGRPSLWCTNSEGEAPGLYRNEFGRFRETFRYVTPQAGITAAGHVSPDWGTGFLDIDNDGALDLVIVNGHRTRYPECSPRGQWPMLLHNDGKGKFTFVSRQAAGPYFQSPHQGRGLAVGDLDNDGRLDLVISNVNEPVALLRNVAPAEGPRAHWLGIEVVGDRHREVTGARVVVERDGAELTRFATGGGSYLSSGDRRLLFGLGKSEKVRRVRVFWPSGREQSWDGLAVDRYWRLTEGQDAAAPASRPR
jgi:RNA polymerase sigma factor (sigma-70 family)